MANADVDLGGNDPVPPPGTPGGKKRVPPEEPRGEGLRVLLTELPITSGGLGFPFMFQCPPLDSFPVAYSWQFTDYDTIGDGIHSRPASDDLTTIAYRSVFVDPEWATNGRLPKHVVGRRVQGNHTVLDVVDELLAIGRSKTPFLLQAGQKELWGRWDVELPVTLRSIVPEHVAGEPDARYFTIAFTEFNGVSAAGGASDATVATTRTASGIDALAVLSADALPPGRASSPRRTGLRSMRALAKRFYGDPALWTLIAKASGLTGIDGNADLRVALAGRRPKPKIVVPALPMRSRR